MLYDILSRMWKAIFAPEIRLQANFPWSFARMAKAYAVATAIYFAGSLAPVGLFVLFMAYMSRANPELLMKLIWDQAHNQPNMLLIAGLTVVSFMMGFGSELLYIRRVFHRDGISMRKALGLNLDSLGGSWWAAIWRVAVAFGVVLVLQQLLSLLPLPAPVDPAADLGRSMTGFGLVAFALLASLAAPFFEELVFRGFLFNVCRASFRKGPVFKLLRTEQMADYAAITVSAAAFAGAHMTLSGFPALFIMGVVLAALYRRSGSLICPMLLHALNNSVCIALLVLNVVSH